MSRARRRVCAAYVALLVLASGCTDREDQMQDDLTQQTAEARERIDALAAELGDEVEVSQDAIVDCVPGDRDSGKTLVYSLVVTVGSDAAARLPDLAARYEADGWRARMRGDNDLQLTRDGVSMGATVFADEGRANVSGGSGCVR